MKRASLLLTLLAVAGLTSAQQSRKPNMASATKQEWPNTTPPDKSDPYWEFNDNLSVNGTPYRKVEVSPNKWQWQVDKKTLKAIADEETHRRELYLALRTRVLTDAEWKEVLQYGDNLNIENMVGYRPEEKARELNDAYRQQQRLRLGSKEVSK